MDRGATSCCIRSLEERHVEDGRLRQQPKANDGLGGWRLAGIYQQAGKLVVGCGKWPNPGRLRDVTGRLQFGELWRLGLD